MMERPILFNGEMMRAILEGRKTQTRRIMKVQPPNDGEDYLVYRIFVGDRRDVGKYRWFHRKCLAARVNTPCFSLPWENGDRLWVKETWCGGPASTYYRADGETINMPLLNGETFDFCRADGLRWKPSIFMPRWASRITLEVADIRVERLQDITEEGAKREGVPDEYPIPSVYCPRCAGLGSRSLKTIETGCPNCDTAKKRFKNLWDSINSRKPGRAWDDNPWVWVIEFRRVKGC